jgi:hypothetical protein
MFASDAQGHTAGGEDGETASGAEQACEDRGRLRHLLTVVQHQQQTPCADCICDAVESELPLGIHNRGVGTLIHFCAL